MDKNFLTEDQLENPQSIWLSHIDTTNLLKQEQDYINYKIKIIDYFNTAKGICYGLSSMWLFGKGISKDINNETLTHDDTNKIWINDDKYIYNINELLKKSYLTLDDQQKLNIDVFIQNLLASHHTVEKRENNNYSWDFNQLEDISTIKTKTFFSIVKHHIYKIWLYLSIILQGRGDKRKYMK
ncbi:hypothetical protein [Candidatus Tisiphia endosymbiont of Dioctria rufipes]|uniref:hypothetical protein n=1 Tax=Candidatus Tisiphia endosymbiont of Dioctria rufipes TaxID=3066255 RepID=UPI00312CABAF